MAHFSRSFRPRAQPRDSMSCRRRHTSGSEYPGFVVTRARMSSRSRGRRAVTERVFMARSDSTEAVRSRTFGNSSTTSAVATTSGSIPEVANTKSQTTPFWCTRRAVASRFDVVGHGDGDVHVTSEPDFATNRGGQSADDGEGCTRRVELLRQVAQCVRKLQSSPSRKSQRRSCASMNSADRSGQRRCRFRRLSSTPYIVQFERSEKFVPRGHWLAREVVELLSEMHGCSLACEVDRACGATVQRGVFVQSGSSLLARAVCSEFIKVAPASAPHGG
jgi:hypothetical protein